MKNQLIQIGVYILIGVIIGITFFKCERDSPIVETVTETVIKTDTVYVNIRDTVYITRTEIEHEYIRDTVLMDYNPVVNRYMAQFPVVYGSIYINGEVLGEVLNMKATTDFKLPTVTNTITNTVTNTVVKNSNGLFITAGLEQSLKPNVGAVFIRNKFLGGYQYNFDSHSIYIGRKIF